MCRSSQPSNKLNLRSPAHVSLLIDPRSPRYNDEDGCTVFLLSASLGFIIVFWGEWGSSMGYTDLRLSLFDGWLLRHIWSLAVIRVLTNGFFFHAVQAWWAQHLCASFYKMTSSVCNIFTRWHRPYATCFVPYVRACTRQWLVSYERMQDVLSAWEELSKTIKIIVKPVKPRSAKYKTATNPCKTGKTGTF